MKLKKIYSQGEILDVALYDALVILDQNIVFKGCANEFKENRDWWVVLNKYGVIIAYCGCLYSEGICIFVRALVDRKHRGNGLQRRMILTRIRAAKRNKCKSIITYTTTDNIPSANNLIKCGFVLYNPSYAYVGKNVLYWIKK